MSNPMPKPMPTTILTVEQRARLIKLMETASKDMKLSLADRIERAHTAKQLRAILTACLLTTPVYLTEAK